MDFKTDKVGAVLMLICLSNLKLLSNQTHQKQVSDTSGTVCDRDVVLKSCTLWSLGPNIMNSYYNDFWRIMCHWRLLALPSQGINYILKYIKMENSYFKIMIKLQYCCCFCIFWSNTFRHSKHTSFKNILKTYWPQTWMAVYIQSSSFNKSLFFKVLNPVCWLISVNSLSQRWKTWQKK